MKLKYEFLIREIMGEYVVVPVGESAIAVSGMIVTNDVGALLWEKLKAETSKQELIGSILEEFDTDPATAENDVTEFLANLQKLELLDCSKT